MNTSEPAPPTTIHLLLADAALTMPAPISVTTKHRMRQVMVHCGHEGEACQWRDWLGGYCGPAFWAQRGHITGGVHHHYEETIWRGWEVAVTWLTRDEAAELSATQPLAVTTDG